MQDISITAELKITNSLKKLSSRDLKSFNGGVIYAGETIQNYISRTGPNIETEKIVVSDIKEYAELYNPSELYVMDLAVVPEGIKIVEYNCWNASGVYHCNIRDIIFQVNEIKSSR